MTDLSSAHRWNFYRAGGVDQVRLDTGADILNLCHLDQKLWIALSCPVKGLCFDERTLSLLDSDADGRVRAPELLGAIKWLGQVLKSADELVAGRDGVPLASINAATPEGKEVLASAKHILSVLGKPSQTTIDVADACQATAVLHQAKHNGDGVVPPASVDDEELRTLAEEIVAASGGVADRSEALGFDAATLATFFAECEAFDAWQQQAEADASLLPFGDKTAAASGAVEAVEAKVDDFFARCRLAAFDARAIAALNRGEADYLAIAAQDLRITADEVRAFPLATVEAGKALPLSEGVNPAWAAALAALREVAGSETLSEAEWSALGAKLGPYRAWQAGKQGAQVEALGIERVRAILAADRREELSACIAADLVPQAEIAGVNLVERLTRYHRDLHRLLNNFVSFTDFYARRLSIFQAGTLYLDGRALELCVRVEDAAKHSVLAAMAKAYLAYVECTRVSGEKMTVACAFTSGDSDNLFVGRNGLFYDREGRDWDATITKIVDNPISIRQAFWTPYKKLVRWIDEMVAKRAAAADGASTTKLQGAATATGTAATAGAAAAPKPKFDVGVVAALGVAVGGITAALAGVFGALSDMSWWQLPLVALGVMLTISLPSMVIAWLKLRQRNLGPILDANGWAVNALTKINIPLGNSLTALPTLPPGARRSLKDPYAPKKSIWARLALLLLVLGGVGYGLWHFEVASERWPEWVPKQAAPAATPAATPGATPGATPEAGK